MSTLAKDELELAENALDEHTIRAPFSGVIMKRIKNPGESVRANEPVVELGNLDKLRVFAFIPLEYVYRVTEGAVVEFQVRRSTAPGADGCRSSRRNSAARSRSSTRRSRPARTPRSASMPTSPTSRTNSGRASRAA